MILYDRYNLSDNIYAVIFSTKQQEIVAKQIVMHIKRKGGEISKTEMSDFATKLDEGELVTELDEPEYAGKRVKLRYNKRQFYDRILTPLRSMGLIDFDLYSRTYKISENFNKDMMKIGSMWLNEVKTVAHNVKKT